ncbi:hypothetical protein M422DRAFT_267100 [Sphaerobolus stellatus SS14]|uniref:Uncharacterized protein n=1 Tax=Sphaerobolus stellatus (strain SS14) TaxID=990650 RepID=A0A0C9TMT9_SPHS4|nr:hypothetical protein M422DRAFT_267100 [Sphaerobolus stellatus SS14]
MLYRQPISDEQLAPFLEAAKLMTIPANEVSPLVFKEVPVPSASQNKRILAMHQALIAEAIDTNTKKRERRKAEEVEAKQRAEAEVAKRKAEEAAAKKAVEEENEHAMDVNSEGEDEVDLDEMLKSKSKKKTKSRPIVDSESEEETEEVKAKRRKAKGKGKAVDSDYKRNMVPVDYTGCPGVPVHKICEGCKVPPNVWCQRPCMGDIQMDANNQIFYVRSKDCCFVCLMRNNVCSFTQEDEADFIMPEATDDEELQAKLKKLCDEQDVFKTQKDKEKAERSKNGNRMKAGTKETVQVNAKASGSNTKASGSTPKGSKRKVVSEEDEIAVEARPKRARTVVNSTGSNERIPSVAESLHGINQALIQTNRDLYGESSIHHANAYSPSPQPFGELERRAGIWPMEDEEHVNEEVEPAELEDMKEEVEEVREEVEEVHEEVEEVKGGHEVEDDKTMKDPEADEL